MMIPRELEQRLGPMQLGRVGVDDGTQLLYQAFGHGPAVVFANGIGVRYPGALLQIEALRRHYQVICWDYRGLGQSVLGREDADLSIQRHAKDSLAILEHLHIGRSLFVGWSMGVQVGLEAAQLDRARIAGLVALQGTYGRPFDGAFPARVSRAVEAAFRLIERFPWLNQLALDLAVSLPALAFFVLKQIRFVGPHADPVVFAANVHAVAGTDKRIYARIMLELARHNADAVLPRLGCPLLVIAGEHDWLTPPRVAMALAASVPEGSYREVKQGSHFALIEKPALVNGWIMEFAERVLPHHEPEDAGAASAR